MMMTARGGATTAGIRAGMNHHTRDHAPRYTTNSTTTCMPARDTVARVRCAGHHGGGACSSSTPLISSHAALAHGRYLRALVVVSTQTTARFER